MGSLFSVEIKIPALDRLLDYVTGKHQAEIDKQVARIRAMTARLKASVEENTNESEH